MQGINVIVDRYAYSGVAYSFAKGLDINWCKAADKYMFAPDLVLFLHISPVEAATRSGFSEERFESIAFQQKVDIAYKQLMDPSWIIIDASQCFDVVQEQVYNAVSSVLNNVKDRTLDTLWK